MKFKNEKCILIIAPFNEKSSYIIKDLLDSNLKIRIVTDNLKEFKKCFFDLWEKFESVSQLEMNYLKFTKQKEKYFETKYGTTPEYVIFLKLQNHKEDTFLHEMDLINFLPKQKNIKKLIYVELNNTQRTCSLTYTSPLIQTNHKYSIQNILDYYLESTIRRSGINYLIIKNLDVQCDSSVFSEDHVTFSTLESFLLKRINLINYKNFKELINIILEGKIFTHDSTYILDKDSLDSIVNYSSPQFIHDYYNFLYRDRYYKKYSNQCNIVTQQFNPLNNTSKLLSVISIALAIKLCGYSIRFLINKYK
jgi:hypothetical protein